MSFIGKGKGKLNVCVGTMSLTFSKLASLAMFVAVLSLTGCTGSSLTSLGNNSALGPTGTTCSVKSDPNAFDQTQKTWICKWQKPAGSTASALTYIGHVDNDASKLWDVTTFTTPNTSQEVTVPTTGGPWLFAVSAQKGTKIYHDFDYVVLEEEGSGNVVDFAGIKDLASASRDFYTARWEACRSKTTGGILPCVYSVYRVVGGDSRQLFLLGTTVDLAMRIQTSGQAGEQFLVRARDTGQNDPNGVLLSDSLKVGTGYPVFEGIKVAQVAAGVDGLSKGKLFWNAVEDTSQIKGYQVFMSQSRNLPTGTATQSGNPASWPYQQLAGTNMTSSLSFVSSAMGTLVNPAATEVNIYGLNSNTTYYFTVRAVNTAATVAELNRVDRSISTKEYVITQGFKGITQLNQATGTNFEAFSNLDVVWNTPDWEKPGVADRYKITYQAVNACDDPWDSSALTASVADISVTGIRLSSLSMDTMYKVMVQAQLGVGGEVTSTTNYLCRKVTADPPVFTGIGNAIPTFMPDPNDPLTINPLLGFNNLTVSFVPATGNWTGYTITATPVAGSPGRCVPVTQNYPRASTSPVQLEGLDYLCQYRLQMVAKYECPSNICPPSGIALLSGNKDPGTGILAKTEPTHPEGQATKLESYNENTGYVEHSTPQELDQLYDQFLYFHAEGANCAGVLASTSASTLGTVYRHMADPANPLYQPSRIVTVGVGPILASPRTFPWPDVFTPDTNHCMVAIPRYSGGGNVEKMLYPKNAIVVAQKIFKVESVGDFFQGVLTAYRVKSDEGFRRIEMTYRRPHANEEKANNFVFAEGACAKSVGEIKDCFGYSRTDLSSCPNKDLVVRDSVVGPAPADTTEIRTLSFGTIATPYPVDENVKYYCRIAAVNDRGLPTAMWNAGSGQKISPGKIKNTNELPPYPGEGGQDIGMTAVEPAGSTSIDVEVKLPKKVVDSPGGGLFSHVLIAILRTDPEPTANDVEQFFNNLTSASPPGSMIDIGTPPNNRTVVAVKDASGADTNVIFADINDGLVYSFASPSVPTKALLRFRFTTLATGNYARLSNTTNVSLRFRINNLLSNKRVAVLAKPVYMVDSFPSAGVNYSHYLQGVYNVGAWTMPQAVAPLFPSNVESPNYTTSNVSGVRLNSDNGTTAKPDVSTNITYAFDKLHVDLPAVTSNLSECDGIQVAVFDAGTDQSPILPPAPNGESDDEFAQRIFGPGPVANRIEVTDNSDLIYQCTASPSFKEFVAVEAGGVNPNLKRYGRYYVVARAFKEATPQMSRGARLFSTVSFLMPNALSDTEFTSATVNDPRMQPCTTTVTSNCYDSTIAARGLGAKYTAKLTFKPPAEVDTPYPGYLNRTYIWKEYRTGSGALATAGDAARDRGTTKADYSGPTGCPDFVLNRNAGDTTKPPGCSSTVVYNIGASYAENPGAWTFIDPNVMADVGGAGKTCYHIRTVYSDFDDLRGRYLASTGTSTESGGNGYTRCIAPTYSPPSASVFGVTAVSTAGTCSTGVGNADNTAKLRLTVSGTSLEFTSIDQFYIYYSPTAPPTLSQSDIDATFRVTDPPLAIINKGDPTFDTSIQDGFIDYGCAGKTMSSGYFHVRTMFGPAGTPTVNVKYNASSYSISPTLANWTYIPPAFSKLAYGYYIMTMEASLSAGATGNDNISTDPVALPACQTRFHDFNNATGWNPSLPANQCGTAFTTTARAESKPGVYPANVRWPTAYTACRNAGSSGFRVRLPTQQEWIRATQWAGNGYTSMTAGTNFYGDACNFSGSRAFAGSSSGCKNFLNVADAAGNMREWVDARMRFYDMTPHQRNFTGASYTSEHKYLGRQIDNGLDRTTPLFNLLDPGSYGMALLMGSGFDTATTYTHQKDIATESWQDLDTSNLPVDAGFRCVAFTPQVAPTMEQLEQPQESRYADETYTLVSPSLYDDTPSTVKNWTIPRQRYARTRSNNFGDYRFERITYDTASYTGGKITIKWAPWEKTCGATCIGQIRYHIYRFQEPTLKDERFNPIWAVGPNGSGEIYNTPKPLNPLAVTSSGTAIWTPITGSTGLLGSANCVGAAPYSCSYTDDQTLSNSDKAGKAWMYVIVAEDNSDGNDSTHVGNFAVASVQRFRTPLISGPPATRIADGVQAATFRTEPRLRRVSLALLDSNHSLLNQSVKQYLAWVPMHDSGLDHDFYVFKYESSRASGSVTYADPSLPISNSGNSPTWASDAALCHESVMRTGDYAAAANAGAICGSASPSLVLQSVPGTTPGAVPVSDATHGTVVRGCYNATAEDADATGHKYYPMRGITQPELAAAGDWGDFDFDGTIDRNPFNVSAENQAYRPYESSRNNCIVDVDQAGTPTGSLSRCVSTYGVFDVVGSLTDRSIDRFYGAMGLDNGIDGIMMGQANRSGTPPNSFFDLGFQKANAVGTTPPLWDLWRMLPSAAQTYSAVRPPVAVNTYYAPSGGLNTITMGGVAAYAVVGYWHHAHFDTNHVDSIMGRCGF